MAFSLDDIRGELRKGVARSSHYELIIGPQSISYRAISLTAPGRSISAAPSGVYGAVQEIGYAAQYAPVSTTIYCSPDHSERKYFTEWQDEIVGGHRTKRTAANDVDFDAGYYDSYVKDVTIKQYDEKGSKTHEIKLIEAYPRTVGELNYTYQTNELLVFTVSFQYRYFNE